MKERKWDRSSLSISMHLQALAAQAILWKEDEVERDLHGRKCASHPSTFIPVNERLKMPLDVIARSPRTAVEE